MTLAPTSTPSAQELFAELTALDIQRQDAAAAAAAGDAPPAARAAQRPLIDPTPLREAINALPGQEFKIGESWCQLGWVRGGGRSCCPATRLLSPTRTQPLGAPSLAAGEMSDAGELLLVLFEHVKAAAPPAAAAAVEAAFGLQVAEAVRCTKCGMVTQEGRYTQVRCAAHALKCFLMTPPADSVRRMPSKPAPVASRPPPYPTHACLPACPPHATRPPVLLQRAHVCAAPQPAGGR